MGPKVEAALVYLSHPGKSGGRKAMITSPEQIPAAVRGEGGTEILPPATLKRKPRQLA
jgi:carbamate kinase